MDFWKRYVEGHALPDYAALLDRAGIIVRKADARRSRGSAGSWVRRPAFGARGGRGGRGGAPAASDNAPANVINAPAGTPLYDAGLDIGDVITSVDGKPVTTAAEFAAAVAAHKPGDRVAVEYTGLAGPKSTTIVVAENPRLEAVTYEDAGRTPSADQLAFRASWLGPKAP